MMTGIFYKLGVSKIVFIVSGGVFTYPHNFSDGRRCPVFSICGRCAIFVLAMLLLPSGFTHAQTYTSNGNCFNWGDGNCWTKVDDGGTCTNNTSLFPPSNPRTTCPVKVVINHPMTFATSLTFGGAFESITFGPSGSFTMTNSITISDNYTLNIYGNPLDENDFFKTSGVTLGSDSRIEVDQEAKLIVTGITQFTKQNAWIKVDGYFQTGSIATTGNSSLTLEVDQDATVIVDLDIDLNGNSKLSFVGNGTDPEYINEPGNSRSVVDIKGRVKTNGSNAELVADNITVFVCIDIDDRVKLSKPNTGKFETKCFSALPVNWLNYEIIYEKSKHQVKVHWSTLKEWENSHFVIERAVDQVDSFQSIGEVEGAGWSSGTTSYNFIDAQLPGNGGMVYYRLRQVDYSGEYQYSEVEAVKLTFTQPDTDKWIAFPNPTNGESLNVKFASGNGTFQTPIKARLHHGNQIEAFEAVDDLVLNQWLNNEIKKATKGICVLELGYEGKVYHLKLIKI